ncbi:hypothetical protein FQR65_LT02480 [Abscondita terminalis]|nr:hypothetical protein FQR65_LT02480 [Abscondita terminalis]
MNSPSKTWSVIKFPEEDSVSAVPSSWLLNHDRCFWPPYSQKLVRTAIEKHEPPDVTNWQLFPCIGFRNNIFDTFKEANKKSVLATKSSDLETSESATVLSRKRKIFRKRFSSSSSSEEDIQPSLPTPPQLKKQEGINRNSKSYCNSSLNLENASIASSSNVTMEAPKLDHEQSFTNGEKSNSRDIAHSHVVVSTEENLKTIIKYLQQLVKKQNILQSMMVDLGERITNLENIRTNMITEDSNQNSIFTIIQNLPVNSREDLDELETYLTNDGGMQNAIKEISQVGGRTIYEFIFRSMQRLITNQFCGSSYSFQGRRQKESFCKLKLYQLLTKATMNLFKDVTMKEIELNISKWLRRCSERSKNKQ